MGPPGCKPGGTYSSTKLPDDGDKRRCSLAKLEVMSTSLRNSDDRAAINERVVAVVSPRQCW